MQKSIFQSIIKFYHKNLICPEDFILSNANQQVFLYISKWPDWYGNTCFIWGEKGTGKTHLTKLWQKRSDSFEIDLFHLTEKELEKHLKKYSSFIIDDIDNFFVRKFILQNLDNNDFDCFEAAIMKIVDYCKNENKYLLMTSSIKPQDLQIKTADLKSRILSACSFTLKTPDESSLRTLLVKLFSEYQLKISLEVIQYICSNVEKSFSEIKNVATEIDRFSLEKKRSITIPLVKEVLNQSYRAIEDAA